MRFSDELNPYRPPGAICPAPAEPKENIAGHRHVCPACGEQQVSFWRLYVRGPWHVLQCRQCQAALFPQKDGLGRFSEYFLLIPTVALALLGICNVYWNPWLFVSVFVFGLLLDCLIDSRLMYLVASRTRVKRSVASG